MGIITALITLHTNPMTMIYGTSAQAEAPFHVGGYKAITSLARAPFKGQKKFGGRRQTNL